MNSQASSYKTPKRKLAESALAWAGLWVIVAMERHLNQWADTQIIALAWSIQCAHTFAMSLWCMHLYDITVDKFPWELSESLKKLAVGWFLATLSWGANYLAQSKTQWSIEESGVMVGLSALWIVSYEFDFVPKIKLAIDSNKSKILEIILSIWNIAWLR